MRLTGQKGSTLVPLIIAVVLMSALGISIYNLTTSSSYGELQANNNDNAYELALAGMRYGVSLGQSNFPATTFQMPDSNHTFTISITSGTVTSTGVVNPGTLWEARRVLTSSLPSGLLVNNGIIGFNNGDMPGFGSPTGGGSNASNAIVSNGASNSVILGGSVYNSFGSLFYDGSSAAGSCTNGACSFGQGLNVYFEFIFPEDNTKDSTNSGDGFTFAIISAITNTLDSTGGNPSAALTDSSGNGAAGGELLGYAGPGNTGKGIILPKMALQFDTYPNAASADLCGAGSRNDATSNANWNFDNVSLMFWGSQKTLTGNCTYSQGANQIKYPMSNFGDNVHGASDPNSPANAPNSTGGGDYYAGSWHPCKSNSNNKCNWMEDGNWYVARMEIVRAGAANSSGTYDYRIRAWVGRKDGSDNWSCAGTFSANNLTQVQTPYTDCSPQIDRTVSLLATDHGNFSKIYFGFTEATGAATQQPTIQNLRVAFPTYLSIVTASLPSGRQGVAYSTTLEATGGTPPYRWSATGLPSGLSIDPSSGLISSNGTLTAGPFAPTITVTDSSSPKLSASATFSLIILWNIYTIYNSTNGPIYYGSNCASSIPANGGTTTIGYNAPAVTFYSSKWVGCSGNSIAIAGSDAQNWDFDYDGNVQIKSSGNSFQLVDK